MMKTSEGAWFVTPRANPRAAVRLFCFPFAGGGTMTFREWPESMSSMVEVVSVQLPGRDRRRTEPPIPSVGAMVESIAGAMGPHLDRPFLLCGHSMGAVLAFETARELRRRARRTPDGIIVSGRRAPHLPDPGPTMHTLSDVDFKSRLREMNGTPPEVLESDELMDLVLPTLRADFQACETHVYRDEPALDCPLLALGGDADPDVEVESVAAWAPYTTAEFESVIITGDHFFIQTRAPEYLAHTRRWIERCLSGSEREDEVF